jgi:hypothetical protein
MARDRHQHLRKVFYLFLRGTSKNLTDHGELCARPFHAEAIVAGKEKGPARGSGPSVA